MVRRSAYSALSDIELVMECTGKFLSVATLQPYLDRGVKQVVASAPVKEKGTLNVVLGCNHEKFTDQKIITNASCTTNCLAPIVKVIQESFGIKHGCITTIHVRCQFILLFLLWMRSRYLSSCVTKILAWHAHNTPFF